MTGCGGSPPRDASVYAYSEHFTDTLQDPLRFLTEDMVQETIEQGRNCDRIEAGAGKLRRKHDFEGVDAVLVLPEYTPYIVTGWTEINSLEAALASPRWSYSDIQKIDAFEKELHKKRITVLDEKTNLEA
mgnify:CR=1 FL=1